MSEHGEQEDGERKSVGELTEGILDKEQRVEERVERLSWVATLLGGFVAAATVVQDAFPLGGSAVALVAAFVGVGGVAAAWLVGESVRDRESREEPQPLAPGLQTLSEQLGAMRRPLLASSEDARPARNGDR